jgi:hypothetical protein
MRAKNFNSDGQLKFDRSFVKAPFLGMFFTNHPRQA